MLEKVLKSNFGVLESDKKFILKFLFLIIRTKKIKSLKYAIIFINNLKNP